MAPLNARSLATALLLLCAAFGLGAGAAHAQAGSPALDPNCYFPDQGNPAIYDSIYGSHPLQELGRIVRNAGPKPGGSYSRMNLWGLDVDTLTVPFVDCGPTLDLHHLTYTQFKDFGYRSNGKRYSYDFVQFVHLHSPRLLDMLVSAGNYRVYWSDENGDYDTSRYTDLLVDLGTRVQYGFIQKPYISRLTSDSVDDLVTMVADEHQSIWQDTSFWVWWKGGSELYNKGRAAYPDSTIYNYWKAVNDSSTRYLRPLEIRGNGINDLLATDTWNNIFYYRATRPFSLSAFREAMLYDTLLAGQDSANQKYNYKTQYGAALVVSLTLHAFPRPPGNMYQDIGIQIPLSKLGIENEALWIFRGGPDFGTHRITLDSAEARLYSPEHYDPGGFYDGGISEYLEGGDPTGTGNHILYSNGGSFSIPGFTLGYALGKAFDSLPDMMIPMTGWADGADAIDTITADGDASPDLALGCSRFSSHDDYLAHNQYVGSLRIFHGAYKIPIRPSVKYGVSLQQAAEAPMLRLGPNPATDHVTLWLPKNAGAPLGSETGRVDIYDILGRCVQHYSMRPAEAALKLDISGLSPGAYQVVYRSRSTLLRAPLSIVR